MSYLQCVKNHDYFIAGRKYPTLKTEESKQFRTKRQAQNYIDENHLHDFIVYDPAEVFMSIYNRYTYIGGGYFNIKNKKSIIAYARNKNVYKPENMKLTVKKCPFTGTYTAIFE